MNHKASIAGKYGFCTSGCWTLSSPKLNEQNSNYMK